MLTYRVFEWLSDRQHETKLKEAYGIDASPFQLSLMLDNHISYTGEDSLSLSSSIHYTYRQDKRTHQAIWTG